MFNRNRLFPAFILGLLLPVVSLAFLMLINEKVMPPFVDWLYHVIYHKDNTLNFSFDSQTLYVFGVLFNLLPFTFYRRRRYDEALRGIFLSTTIHFVLFILWKSVFTDFALPAG